MNLREAATTIQYASLEWSEHERAVDRVAACGKADALGVAIWKAKYGLESACYHAAVKGLTKAYLARYKREGQPLAEMLCEQVLSEFIAQFCVACQGRRELVIDDRMQACTACAGSGVRRYTDEQRARMMRISHARVLVMAHKIRWVHDLISRLDGEVNVILTKELGLGQFARPAHFF
jgi:hypothetical protein